MGKPQPPNTKGHQLYLPNELDRKIKTLATYGTVDDFIIKCIEEGLEPHWNEYVIQEYARLQEKKNENGPGSVRRSSQANAGETTAENVGNKKREKQSRKKA